MSRGGTDGDGTDGRDWKHDSALSQSRKLICCDNYYDKHDKRFYDSSLLENSGSLCLHANARRGCDVWMSSELRSGGGESPTAGPEERHQPALVHNTYGMIVCTSSRKAGCCYTHFYCTSICGLRGPWVKAALIKGFSGRIFPLRSQLLEMSCVISSLWNLDVVPRGTALPPAHRFLWKDLFLSKVTMKPHCQSRSFFRPNTIWNHWKLIIWSTLISFLVLGKWITQMNRMSHLT